MPSLPLAAAALTLLAAGVHLGVAPAHFGEHPLAGAFFVTVAVLQAAWARAAVLGAGRQVLVAGAVVNLSVAATWVASRTAGLPALSGAGGREPVGALDVACTAAELAAVVVTAVLVARGGMPRSAVLSPAAATFAVAALVGVAGGAVSSVPGASTHAGLAHRHGAADHASAASAAAPSAPAAAGGHHGAREETAVTPAQQAAADRLLAETRQALARYADVERAVADRYRPITPPDEVLVHYGKVPYLLDGAILAPGRVESLVYARTGAGTRLLGAMYMMPPGVPGLRVGGNLTRWHAHDDLCVDMAQVMVVRRNADGTCPAGSAVTLTPEMLHVWLVDYPGGPFGELDAAHVRQALLAL